MGGDFVPESDLNLKGMQKYFNTYTLRGRFNTVVVTYATVLSTFLLYKAFRSKPEVVKTKPSNQTEPSNKAQIEPPKKAQTDPEPPKQTQPDPVPPKQAQTEPETPKKAQMDPLSKEPCKSGNKFPPPKCIVKA